ncbi:MAG: radical SAM protein [Clostridiales bacterium]|nr:radical SAM protein [Clostridiales bacterium]
MELGEYINDGIKNLAASLSKFYLTNVKGIKFLKDFVPELKRSMKRREELERTGQHVPPFLIASIASGCNLRCKGCYARAGGLCESKNAEEECDEKFETIREMNVEQWGNVFQQASDIGVSFILLAGGEPMLRRDVLKSATEFKNMIFPVFTNGTLIDGEYIQMFDDNRNMFPVFSMEGDRENTDERRGAGVFQRLENAMAQLRRRKVIFGVSITVNKENLEEVTSYEFLKELHEKGCGVVFYIEYVPAQEGTEDLALSKEQAEKLIAKGERLKKQYSDMSVLLFPGDEKYMGGCLAAGRGFFHINPKGGAEACPFAPYSRWNVREHSLLEIVNSSFFERVRELEKKGVENHLGGCTLFNYKDEMKLLAE